MPVIRRHKRTLGMFLAKESNSLAVILYSAGTSSSLISHIKKLFHLKCKTMSVIIPMVEKRRKKTQKPLASQTSRTKIALSRRLIPALKAQANLEEYTNNLTCFAF